MAVAGDFRTALAHRAAWRLLARGLAAFLPERASSLDLAAVEPVRGPSVPYEPGPLVSLTEYGGFGLQLPTRVSGPEPEREIFVRGRGGQSIGSIGIVVVGSSPGIGTRVVDAARILRYARGLTFRTLYEPLDAGSVVAAMQAVRAVENVVFVDLALGVGLCAELDSETGVASCPLLVRFGPRGAVRVQAHVPEPVALSA